MSADSKMEIGNALVYNLPEILRIYMQVEINGWRGATLPTRISTLCRQIKVTAFFRPFYF